MSKKIAKSQMQVPFKYLLIAIGVLALSFLGIAVMLKELHEAEIALGNVGKSEYVNTGYELVIEFFKTIFVAVALGWGVEVYLKYLEIVHSQKETLAKSGIVDLYHRREDASNKLISLVKDTRVSRITICGISLRDFLHGHPGPTHSVWMAIKARLENERKNNDLPAEQRLHVRLLILDPGSAEGHFRYLIEEPSSAGNPVDVGKSLNEVRKTLNIYKDAKQDFLRAQLYDHCPFSFVFLTDASAFIEQYYYRTAETEASLPLLEYAANSDQYSIVSASVEAIWNNSSAEPIEIGTAIPIREARIKNIYLRSKREKQGEHQAKRIRMNRAPIIDILSITGGFYVDEDFDASTELRAFAVKTNVQGGTVRFALLNPISQQAIFRAVADECRTNEIGDALSRYDWKTHRNSRLYFRLGKTIKRINQWSKDHRLDLHLYSCAPTCAMLLTSESAFVGHYVYGRSKRLQKENKLHAEYPMLEFASSPDSEEDHQLDILRSTFQIIWDHYSIPYEKYSDIDKEDAFNKNLSRLKEELGAPIS